MESTQAQIAQRHTDMMAARRTASQIINLLDRFIPNACRREAHEWLEEVAFKEGFELTTKLMRKEYEEWKKLQVNALGLSSHFSKPE